MGIMRFDLGTSDMSQHFPRFEHAFITNYDGVAYPTRVRCDGQELQCIRQKSDSGKLNIAWPVAGLGTPILRTSSLIERELPYNLPLELARGQLSELRDQAASWSHAGMLIPDDYHQTHRRAYKLFVQASFNQDEPAEAARLANESLVEICRAEDLLAHAYISQRMQVRRQRFAHPPALFGCDLGPVLPNQLPENFTDTFNAAAVTLDWKAIESVEGEYSWDVYDQQVDWALRNKVMVKGGPLLGFQEGDLPNWLENWKHDILNLQSFLSDYVETAVSRYTGKIRMWEVAARMNTGGLFGYTEENLLALTARMIDVARQVDGESQIYVRVDQPWGDYQARGKHRLTPWHVVDALLRSGMGLTGINLEMAVGYEMGRNDNRRLLRFSKLLDTWGSFGLPLQVTIACPSSAKEDTRAKLPCRVAENSWREPWSDLAQARWVDEYLPMLMAKQSVTGIFWSHFDDSLPHRFPHAGLSAEGHSKSALEHLARHRRQEG
ncbi:MAG: endo-1,4-beta-xylanase [Rubinisphaera brasiliensis]|uniref:Glycoside hydrolase family 10 n=1 Tax=Rubinisphaera brasiliensis (strain ATCC 49424 / DSM 5305 / JCM 21570 / IAM 15109 / NBRC 103401 / IFAM 1448) TaxID=756272 RepID=F0SMP4_RUBBR|nr:endo-1,4-beta-xylanase [Rubinisphaera brasiliensis]ADY58863.1 glycoside hydrolase family 10 [Rubinisphaera brasiliensis DSM 5305]